jgi:hypothetical protein
MKGAREGEWESPLSEYHGERGAGGIVVWKRVALRLGKREVFENGFGMFIRVIGKVLR